MKCIRTDESGVAFDSVDEQRICDTLLKYKQKHTAKAEVIVHIEAQSLEAHWKQQRGWKEI